MSKLSPYAIGFLLLGAVSGAAVHSEESIKLVVTEGHYIGYATVADALASLKSRGLAAAPGLDGDNVNFVEPDSRTAWTFAGKDDPAYPSAVRYVYTKSSGVLNAELTILCEASAERCEKFRSDIRDKLAQLAKMMAGDPSAKCRVNDGAMKCSAETERTRQNRQIYVRVGDDASCSIDGIATPCAEIGRKIRAEHPSDDPKVAVCASAKVQSEVARVLSVMSEDHLSPVLGCPPN
jgi:hypothetical protein